MSIMGLDYGDKNIGVAISDELLVTSQGIEVIRRDNPESFKKVIARLKLLIKEYNVKKIILGFPLNMDGSEGPRCIKTKDFKERLNRNFKSIPIVLWDERLSTAFAMKILNEGFLTDKKKELLVDKIAAVFILQGYLDSLPAEEESL